MGCTSQAPAVHQQATIFPSQTVTLAITTPTVNSATPPPHWAKFLSSPVPAAKPDQEHRMFELLQSKDCVLPCYLNIKPGKTSLNEARIILKDIGTGPEGYFVRKDGFAEYSYRIIVGDPLYMFETSKSTDDLTYISQYIELTIIGDIVEGIRISVTAHEKTITKFRQYWSMYSTREIFLQLGAPDHLYTDKGPLPVYAPDIRPLTISYEKKNILIEYFGYAQEINICTKESDRYINLKLALYNSDSGLDVMESVGIPPASDDYLALVEEVLGVNTSEFYNQVLSNPSVCFKPKVTEP